MARINFTQSAIQASPNPQDARPIERIILTPEQRDCVNFRPDGSLYIKGIPGSGKTTVLIERARQLKEKGEQGILLLAYNKALARYMRALSLKNQSAEVVVTHFHEWGTGLLRDAGIPTSFMSNDQRVAAIKFARNTVRKRHGDRFKLPSLHKNGKGEDWAQICFLSEEIAWIKGQGIASSADYLGAERVGRGNQIRVDREHRTTIYDVLLKYEELLRNKYHCRDYDDVALLLLEHANKIHKDRLPGHVLIDEAQDLTAAQFRAIERLTQKSLTIGADKGQKIYRRFFTWKSVGIDVRGARSKTLRNTFRSTRQIIQLARSVQQYDVLLQNDEEYVPPVDPEAEGPVPELYVSISMDEEVKRVLSLVKQVRVSRPDDTIGLIALSRDRLEVFAEAFEGAAIPWVQVAEEGADILSPGVKLVTYYSCKGLEFHHVVVTGLREGTLPFKNQDPGDDEREYDAVERRKLYVAMTRARLSLILSAVQPVSRFVNQLDPALYRRR